jgi:hypothetical protein
VFLPDKAASEPAPQAEESVELVQVLKAQVADLQRRLNDAERERAELRQLVSQAQQLAGARMLPAPTDLGSEGSPETPAPGEASVVIRPRRWRWPWQRA